ncbi:unnamed protein product [Cylicocyclus nassatus]|uniref:Protein-tyrosine phosphatase n=1 Tax=Cylicocyclus nassatus TaxID=53992 RepID=A0AA36GJ65_CYLNA|nr:unnamed protein product [Cylicocyclus nassatus]
MLRLRRTSRKLFGGDRALDRDTEPVIRHKSTPARRARRLFSRRTASEPDLGRASKNGMADTISKAFEAISEGDLPQVSEKWTYMSQAKSLDLMKTRASQVKPFVENALRKRPIGLALEFRQMKRYNDFTKMKAFLKFNKIGKNRYKDVGCLDSSRVEITFGPCSYIHANYVSTPKNPKKFICTQAPLKATCSEFWCMIVQEQTEVILMLCNFIEQKSSKCANYYPLEENDSLSFEDNVNVVNKGREEFTFPFDTKIKIEVTNLEVTVEGHPPRSVKHYHWVDWPDRGVPPADLAPMYLLYKMEEIKTPIVIHCSAGIGRTGCMVLIQTAMDTLQEGRELEDMGKYLKAVRTQRNNSIQNDQQYLFVHQVLLNFLRIGGWLPKTLDPHLQSFTEEYTKMTRGF